MPTPDDELDAYQRAGGEAARLQRALEANDLRDGEPYERARAHAHLRRERDRAELAQCDAMARWCALAAPDRQGEIGAERAASAAVVTAIDDVHTAISAIASAMERGDTADRLAATVACERAEARLDERLAQASVALDALDAASGHTFPRRP